MPNQQRDAAREAGRFAQHFRPLQRGYRLRPISPRWGFGDNVRHLPGALPQAALLCPLLGRYGFKEGRRAAMRNVENNEGRFEPRGESGRTVTPAKRA